MDTKNEVTDEEITIDDIVEQKDESGNDTTDWKALALHNQGIAKRLKTKLSKSKETPKTEEKPETEKKPEGNTLLEKAFLRSAGITDKEEVELAQQTAKKWGMEIDDLVDDDDFNEKLEKFRTKKANLLATSGVKGDKTGSSAKETPEYWVAKGTPPTAKDIPDRKARVKIHRAMMASENKTGKFYND